MARCFAVAVAIAVVASALAASPVPGFRPPAVPLFMNSPYVNIWSTTDELFASQVGRWA